MADLTPELLAQLEHYERLWQDGDMSCGCDIRPGCPAGKVLTALSSLVAAAKERDQLREEVTKLRVETARLEERQQVHLATIARLSQTTPFPEEFQGWESQRAKLIAEVGSLRARVAELSHPLASRHPEDAELRCALAAATLERDLAKQEIAAISRIIGGTGHDSTFEAAAMLRGEASRMRAQRDEAERIQKEQWGVNLSFEERIANLSEENAELLRDNQAIEHLTTLSSRGFAFDLQRRDFGPPSTLVFRPSRWPLPWRARLRPTKAERQNYRLTAFGQTAREALAVLVQLVAQEAAKERANVLAAAHGTYEDEGDDRW